MMVFYSASKAAALGTAFSIGGVGILYSLVNPLTAALGGANILLYSFIYTYTKRTSISNTVWSQYSLWLRLIALAVGGGDCRSVASTDGLECWHELTWSSSVYTSCGLICLAGELSGIESYSNINHTSSRTSMPWAGTWMLIIQRSESNLGQLCWFIFPGWISHDERDWPGPLQACDIAVFTCDDSYLCFCSFHRFAFSNSLCSNSSFCVISFYMSILILMCRLYQCVLFLCPDRSNNNAVPVWFDGSECVFWLCRMAILSKRERENCQASLFLLAGPPPIAAHAVYDPQAPPW